jgi:tRNA modification GTPase
VAFNQAEGALSRRIAPLEESLVDWIARAEAAVEFVDESGTHLPPAPFRAALAELRRGCDELLAGFEQGRVVRSGATLALVGLPNSGKSSLFNRLLARDRAIVTEHAGTTRDTLEEDLDLGGIPLRLIDTAGLRDADHPVESEGVARARRAREEADLVLLVLDGSRTLEPAERAALAEAEHDPGGRTVTVVNKCDLPSRAEVPRAVPRVSALTGAGTGGLRRLLRERLVGSGPLEDPLVSDARHAAALRGAAAALDRATRADRSGFTEELVLEDLKEALARLGEITGEVHVEELYDRIFSTFCIGK